MVPMPRRSVDPTRRRPLEGLPWRRPATPAFGIKVGEPTSKQTTFPLRSSYGLSASSTLKEGLRTRGQALLSRGRGDAIEYEILAQRWFGSITS